VRFRAYPGREAVDNGHDRPLAAGPPLRGAFERRQESRRDRHCAEEVLQRKRWCQCCWCQCLVLHRKSKRPGATGGEQIKRCVQLQCQNPACVNVGMVGPEASHSCDNQSDLRQSCCFEASKIGRVHMNGMNTATHAVLLSILTTSICARKSSTAVAEKVPVRHAPALLTTTSTSSK